MISFKKFFEADAIDRMDAGEAPEAFKPLEDSAIAELFQYRKLTLSKPPKELSHVLKMLKKHLDKPLKSLSYANGTKGEGGRNIAIYSESQDGMGINLTNIKKLKRAPSGGKAPNYNDQLEKNKESLEKWLAWQKKVSAPKDVKKARGMVNRLSVGIHNLEAKIASGDTPVPFNGTAYTKSHGDAIENVVLHELGHRVMDKYDKHKFQVFYNQKQFPTEYSRGNIREYFSEVYALTKMGLIDETVISDEAKSYFKKVIK